MTKTKQRHHVTKIEAIKVYDKRPRDLKAKQSLRVRTFAEKLKTKGLCGEKEGGIPETSSEVRRRQLSIFNGKNVRIPGWPFSRTKHETPIESRPVLPWVKPLP